MPAKRCKSRRNVWKPSTEISLRDSPPTAVAAEARNVIADIRAGRAMYEGVLPVPGQELSAVPFSTGANRTSRRDNMEQRIARLVRELWVGGSVRVAKAAVTARLGGCVLVGGDPGNSMTKSELHAIRACAVRYAYHQLESLLGPTDA